MNMHMMDDSKLYVCACVFLYMLHMKCQLHSTSKVLQFWEVRKFLLIVRSLNVLGLGLGSGQGYGVAFCCDG